MEWFVPADHRAASELRREVRSYLKRHASPTSDIEGAIMAFSELLTNSIEHAKTDVWVSLDWGGRNPIVTFNDLGPGFTLTTELPPTESPSGRGLILASSLSLELRTAAKTAGGSRTSIRLDVDRASSESIDPEVPTTSGHLPRLEEANDDGYFAKGPFLKALVVEMANAVEMTHGPSDAERAVAQVGATVGKRMETAFRDRRDLDGDLTTEQLAEIYLGLKSAIGGDFSVVSIDDDKIVMGNRNCPFGADVRFAPSLCRMTSSVFGGIGARNAGHDVAVHLEERIAVGDPECRVTVWLRPPPSEVEVSVHRYRARIPVASA